ncbi:HDIG domain-containing protein [Vallitalea pronyensis]|uniref:HDIG domain-containing protein n=1 Tax=Vallitalea pronyensis TaxID=1348613 RepID=A0A8J8SHK7_9FIRM|nr:HDIG domain-containing metalloprotein [Vallitalea pronyensis]QUI23532.1 HDIG domain-containing protein [Vallitalea pronyensis]
MSTKENSRIQVNFLTWVLAILAILVTIGTLVIALRDESIGYQIPVVCFGVLLLGLLYLYIYLFHKQLLAQRNKLVLFVSIYILLMITTVVMSSLPYLLIPIPIAGMLIAIMIDNRLGIMTHLVLTLLAQLVSGSDLLFLMFFIVSGTLACMIITQAKKRHMLVFVSGYLVGINIVLILLIHLYQYGNLSQLEVTDVLYSVLNSVFSVIITIGSLPLFETVFDVATPLKLLELTNSDQKLIQRLLLEAPGTYHHSQMVSNLAQTAANDIGANALLARTGAIYHDVGKLKDPMYFGENQDGYNPHDELDPENSAKIIISHVNYGVKLATDHHLPKAVRHIIKQHQGDTVVKYFYHKAIQNNDGAVDEEAFKYDGPKPQTNEAAIIMLADCVEAYVRALPEADRHLTNIEKCIDEIINSKFQEGQLSECHLKIKELPIIGNSFMKVYNGLYHERVKYPDNTVGGDNIVDNHQQ